MFKLRYYQKEAIDTCLKFFNSRVIKKSVAVLPCAAGKSIIIAEIANSLDAPVLLLQPSKELLKQNYNKLISIGGEAEIFSASLDTKNIGKLTYATIGSIKNKTADFKELGLKYVIIDECHYNTKRNGQIDKFLKTVGITKVLGLTATPVELGNTMDGSVLRMLNRSRNNMFSDIIFCTQIKEMVENNFWTPVEYRQVAVNDSMLSYNSTGTEFTEYSIKKFYEENEINSTVTATIKQLLDQGYNSILVTVPSVEEANTVQDYFNVEYVKSLHSKVKSKERDKIVNDFLNGVVKVVVQVTVLSTGFDYPELEVVVDAMPTNSIARYYQFLARVVRIHENKHNALAIDISGNYERFGKLDQIEFKDIENYGWGMFINDELRTSIPLKSDKKPKIQELIAKRRELPIGIIPWGKYKGKKADELKDKGYMEWCLKNWNFKKYKVEWLKKQFENNLEN